MATAEAFGIQAATRGPRSVSTLGKTAAGSLLAMAAIYTYVAIEVFDDPGMAMVILALPLLAVAGIATGWRWTPFVGIVLAGLLGSFEIPALFGFRLHDFRGGTDWTIQVVLGSTSIFMVIVFSLLAGIQNYRKPAGARVAPSWLRPALLVVAGGVVGASLLGLRTTSGAQAQVTTNSLDNLPAIVAANDSWMQSEIHVKQGEVVMRRIDNADNYDHTFDVPDLGIHLPVSGGESGLVMFKADKAGGYEFKCAVFGHDMKGVIVVDPS